jgi:lysozyme family protein
MSFDSCLVAVLQWEGVYDNDPDDAGGETCYGITRKFEPEWVGWANVDGLKAAKIPTGDWGQNSGLMNAVRLYYAGLFSRHRIVELPEAVQALVFGGIVNQGPRVVKFLQEALTKLNQPGDPDGIIGPQTVAGCKNVQTAVLADLLWKRRMQAYIVAAKKGNNGKYLLGWANRLEGGA